MLKDKKIGKDLFLMFLALITIAIACGILIFVVNQVVVTNDIKKSSSTLQIIIGVFGFFIPMFLIYFFFRNKPLMLQCIFSFLIMVAEIVLFLSSLYMGKLNNLFLIKLSIITIGGTCFPVVYKKLFYGT